MTDYHVKVLLQARVPAATRAWARQEADRRGQPFGDFIDSLITAERQRVDDARAAADELSELGQELGL